MDELRERIALLEKRIDELEGSEGRYRVLIDNAFEGVWAVDSEWKTTFVNKRMADMLGYEPEEMIGQVVTAFVEQSNRSVIDGIIERCHNNVGDVYDLNFLSKNGNVIRTRVSASALLDGNERFAGAMALVSDVTARKGMEEALKDSEQRYRVLSESTFEGIVIHNNGIVLDVNQAALDQAGYTREEVLGRSVLDFFGPESRKGIETAISKPVV
ncbi:MAG: PAS domain-containing protein, partial [Candidatus Saccharibacteria bacterium]